MSKNFFNQKLQTISTFDITTSVFNTQPYECTKDYFYAASDCPLVHDVQAMMENLNEQYKRGELTIENYRSLKDAAKKRLPTVLFHSHWTNGIVGFTNGGLCMPSGLCAHDFDVKPNQAPITYESVKDKLDALGEELVYAGKSISGLGLRLVTRLHVGESLADCQERIAHYLGLQNDASVKDEARRSFVVPSEYIHFIDEEQLWPAAYAQPTASVPAPNYSAAVSTVDMTQVNMENIAPILKQLEEKRVAEETPSDPCPETYAGHNWKEIAIEWMRQTKPPHDTEIDQEGTRHERLKHLLKCMAPVLDNRADWLREACPRFGLTQKEVNDLIEWVTKASRALTAEEKQTWRNVIAALDAEEAKKRALPVISDEDLKSYPKALRTSLRAVTPERRWALLNLILPVCGMYATDAKVRHINSEPTEVGQKMPLNFLAITVGNTASGKHDLSRILQVWIDVQEEKDDLSEQAHRVWNKMSQKDKEKTPEPQVVARVLGANVSTADLLQHLNNAEGKCLLITGEELNSLVREQNLVYSQKSDVFCQMFDEARWRVHRIVGASGRPYAHCCLSITGTYESFRALLQTAGSAFENGFANRLMLSRLHGDPFAKMPHYHELTEAEIEEIHKGVEMLEAAKGEIPMPLTRKEIWRWVDEKRAEAAAENDLVMAELRMRVAQMAMRAATIFHILEGTTRETQACIDFSLSLADHIFSEQLYFLGDGIKKQHQKNLIAQKSQNYPNYEPATNDSLLEELPETFTYADVRKLKPDTRSERNIVKRWKDKGKVRPLKKGEFQKLI